MSRPGNDEIKSNLVQAAEHLGASLVNTAENLGRLFTKSTSLSDQNMSLVHENSTLKVNLAKVTSKLKISRAEQRAQRTKKRRYKRRLTEKYGEERTVVSEHSDASHDSSSGSSAESESEDEKSQQELSKGKAAAGAKPGSSSVGKAAVGGKPANSSAGKAVAGAKPANSIPPAHSIGNKDDRRERTRSKDDTKRKVEGDRRDTDRRQDDGRRTGGKEQSKSRNNRSRSRNRNKSKSRKDNSRSRNRHKSNDRDNSQDRKKRVLGCRVVPNGKAPLTTADLKQRGQKLDHEPRRAQNSNNWQQQLNDEGLPLTDTQKSYGFKRAWVMRSELGGSVRYNKDRHFNRKIYSSDSHTSMCMASDGALKDMPNKISLCADYFEDSRCRMGGWCYFYHTRESVNVELKRTVCLDYLKGESCPRRSLCPFQHDHDSSTWPDRMKVNPPNDRTFYNKEGAIINLSKPKEDNPIDNSKKPFDNSKKPFDNSKKPVEEQNGPTENPLEGGESPESGQPGGEDLGGGSSPARSSDGGEVVPESHR